LKLIELREKQLGLMEEMTKEFSIETFRKLNITNHSIRVAIERKKGNWEKSFLQEITIGRI